MMVASKYLKGFEPTWGSVARIAIWCVLFLWLSGKLVPQLPEEIPLAKAEAGTGVIPMLTIFDDHRTVREDFKPDPKKLHVAWVTDSSGAIIPADKKWSQMDSEDYKTIPEFVASRLKKNYRLNNLDVELYMRLGSRPIDSLVFALLAAKQKPDLVVVPVNIVWTFSHYQIMNKTTSLSIAPSLWAQYPQLWYMIPMLCSPIENLWALVGDRFDVIRYASPLKNDFERRYADLVKAFGGSGPAPISMGVPMFNMQFWVVMNMLNGNEAPVLDADGKPGNLKYYTQLINHNSPYHEGSFATLSFMNMIDILRQQGIPVLVYQHPVSDYFYQLSETKAKLKETQDFLDKTSAAINDKGVRLIGSIPDPVRKTIPFRKKDGYHADSDPSTFDDFLADEIWLMLKDNGKLPQPKKGAP